MKTETNLRAGTRSALLAGFQTGKGTALDDLSSARNVWASPVEMDISPIKSEDEWMTSSPLTDSAERINKATKPFGVFRSVATPDTLDLILRSNWGARTGNTFTLSNTVPDWITLLWVEDRNLPTRGAAVRVSDVWLHKVTLEHFDGLVRARCDWAGRGVNQYTPLPETIVLPSTIGPADSERFSRQQFRVTRDPDGVDQEFSAEALSLEIDQRLVHQWDMSDGINLRKGGKPKLSIRFMSRVTDETWQILQRSASAEKDAWRIELLTAGASLRIDLAAVEFRFDPIGRDALNLRRLSFEGKALMDGINAATITLSP
jgi:hypothetical protein